MYVYTHTQKEEEERQEEEHPARMHARTPHDGGGSWGSVILSNRISSKELLNKVFVCLFVF